jgi:hypothetical protein
MHRAATTKDAAIFCLMDISLLAADLTLENVSGNLAASNGCTMAESEIVAEGEL